MRKTLHLIILTLFSCALVSATTRQQQFRVSKTGKDKSELRRVYAAVNEIERNIRRDKGSIYSGIKVVYRISSTEFLVHPKSWKNVSWDASSNRLGMGGNVNTHRSLVVDRTKTYLLETVTPLDLVDGESSSDILTRETGEIKDKHDNEALTGYGGVRVIKEVSRQMITKESFIERLRAGETWTLLKYKSEKCMDCKGDGKLDSARHYARCTDCSGTGSDYTDYVVSW